jgi:hypothetical protein
MILRDGTIHLKNYIGGLDMFAPCPANIMVVDINNMQAPVIEIFLGYELFRDSVWLMYEQMLKWFRDDKKKVIAHLFSPVDWKLDGLCIVDSYRFVPLMGDGQGQTRMTITLKFTELFYDVPIVPSPDPNKQKAPPVFLLYRGNHKRTI